MKVTLGSLIRPVKARRAGKESYPLLSMTMHEGLIDQTSRFKKRIASADTSSYKVVTRGQLVVSFPIDEGVLDFQTHYEEAIVSPAYEIWEPVDPDQVDRNYLKRVLRGPDSLAYYRQKLRGSTARRRSLPKPDFLGLPIPLPSIDKQRRIASILDEADSIRSKRRTQLADLDELPRSLLREIRAEGRWTWQKIGTLGNVTTGRTPPTGTEGMFGGSIPFITPGDLGSNGTSVRTVTHNGAQRSRTVRSGATFVCCIGAIGKTGRARDRSAFNQQINAIEWGDDIDDTFGYYLIESMSSTIARAGTSTTLPLLPKGRFVELEIPVPPLNIQYAFTEKVSAIQSERDRVARALEADDELFAALQYRAFRGEL